MTRRRRRTSVLARTARAGSQGPASPSATRSGGPGREAPGPPSGRSPGSSVGKSPSPITPPSREIAVACGATRLVYRCGGSAGIRTGFPFNPATRALDAGHLRRGESSSSMPTPPVAKRRVSPARDGWSTLGPSMSAPRTRDQRSAGSTPRSPRCSPGRRPTCRRRTRRTRRNTGNAGARDRACAQRSAQTRRRSGHEQADQVVHQAPTLAGLA